MAKGKIDRGKILSCDGSIWLLSKTAYCRLLKAIINGDKWELSEYGTKLGSDIVDVYGIGKIDAIEELKELTKGRSS